MDRVGFKPIYIDNNKTHFYVNREGEVISAKTGRTMKHIFDRDGYERVHIRCRTDGMDKIVYVHRLVACAFVEGDKTLSVNHIDGNKNNNSASNLEFITIEDNIQKYYLNRFYNQEKGTLKSGRRHNVFNQQDVENIRMLYSKGESIRNIANQFNETYNTVYAVVKQKVHKYI